MKRLTTSIFVESEPHWVWRLVADPRRHPEWQPDLIAVSHVRGEGTGANAEWTRSHLGVHFHGTTEVLEAETDRRVVEHDTGAVEAWWTFTFEPEEGGTRVDAKVDYRLAMLGVMEGALRGRGQHELDASLVKLKALAEHEGRG